MVQKKYILGVLVLVSFVLVPLHVTHAQKPFDHLSTPRTLTILSFFPSLDLSMRRYLPGSLLRQLITGLTKSCSLATTSSSSSSSGTSGNSSGSNQTAATMSFFANQNNNWQFTAGFNHGTNWGAYVDPDGAQGAGLAGDPEDSGVSVTKPLEAFAADTNGKYINDSCTPMTYTGDPTVDFACYITEAEAQGYTYVLGQTTGT
jgi:hypothetical protein